MQKSDLRCIPYFSRSCDESAAGMETELLRRNKEKKEIQGESFIITPVAFPERWFINMKFTKMQGIGNDYVYVNCLEKAVEHPAETAKIVSDRHFGIGSDGLILICPSDHADFRMAMYNADGSEGAMCGNGIRCVGKYVYDYGLTDKTHLAIETKSGIKYLDLTVEDGKAVKIRVNMGKPERRAKKIPILTDHEEVKEEPIEAAGRMWKMTGVSMGNPHAVVPYDGDLETMEIEKIGPQFEHHKYFPDRVNTEFIKVLDDHTVRMRVWERGSGETLACGTGACAVAVAALWNQWVGEGPVTVQLLGGELTIEWDRQSDLVYMTGPAEIVFEGEICL